MEAGCADLFTAFAEQAAVDRPIPVVTIHRLARDLLLAIAALHRNGISHFDISPCNIIIRHPATDSAPPGTPLLEQPDLHFALIDFGSACSHSIRTTSLAWGVGPAGYRAPENLLTLVHTDVPYRGELLDGFRSDVWAAGMTLAVLMTSAPMQRYLWTDEGRVLDNASGNAVLLSTTAAAMLNKMCRLAHTPAAAYELCTRPEYAWWANLNIRRVLASVSANVPSIRTMTVLGSNVKLAPGPADRTLLRTIASVVHQMLAIDPQTRITAVDALERLTGSNVDTTLAPAVAPQTAPILSHTPLEPIWQQVLDKYLVTSLFSVEWKVTPARAAEVLHTAEVAIRLLHTIAESPQLLIWFPRCWCRGCAGCALDGIMLATAALYTAASLVHRTPPNCGTLVQIIQDVYGHIPHLEPQPSCCNAVPSAEQMQPIDRADTMACSGWHVRQLHHALEGVMHCTDMCLNMLSVSRTAELMAFGGVAVPEVRDVAAPGGGLLGLLISIIAYSVTTVGGEIPLEWAAWYCAYVTTRPAVITTMLTTATDYTEPRELSCGLQAVLTATTPSICACLTTASVAMRATLDSLAAGCQAMLVQQFAAPELGTAFIANALYAVGWRTRAAIISHTQITWEPILPSV
jgi:serine/threonine protein kinase